MARRRLLAAAALLVLWGCARPVPRTQPAPPASSSRAAAVPLSIEQAHIDAGPWLMADAVTAMGMGAGPLQVLATGAAMEGDRLGGFVALDRATCMLAFARGSQGVDDLDIVVFDDAGTPLAADQATDPRPAVVLCPPHPRRVYVSGKVASGHGLVALGVQSVPPAVAMRLAPAFGARIAERNEILTQAWPGLETTIARRRQALGGRWEELRKAAVSVHPRSPVIVSTPLPATRCLDVLVVPNEETANLEVTLSDETGRELARAPNIGKDRAALVCSPVETTITVGIRPHDGHGLVAIVLSRSGQGDQSELSSRPDAVRAGPMQPLDKVRAHWSGVLARAGHETRTQLATGVVEPGQVVSTPLELAAGCSRIDVLAGAPASGVRAVLWDAHDELIASGEGGEQLALFGCVASARRASLQLTAMGRAGPYALELRKEKAAPPELMHHPLAASRLLARANAGARPITLQDLNEVRRVDLDEARRASFDATVAVSTCMNVVVATEPGASGLNLSAQEQGTSSIVASARGHTVTAMRVCARARALKVRIHATVDTGKAEGVAARYVTTFAQP